MSSIPNDPDEIPRFEVRVYDDDRLLEARRFSALDEAEAFAEAYLDEAPGRRTSIEDVLHSRIVDEEEVPVDHSLIAETLVHGGAKLLDGRYRPIGAKVLRRALELEPWNVQATILLAKTLGKERRKPEAVALLEGLARRTGGKARGQARRLAFWYAPTPARLWRWLSRTKSSEGQE